MNKSNCIFLCLFTLNTPELLKVKADKLSLVTIPLMEACKKYHALTAERLPQVDQIPQI